MKNLETMSDNHSKPACFVSKIDLALKDKFEQDLLGQGFKLSPAPYAFFKAKKQGMSCTLYTSGKLTVQGKEKEEFIEYYLEPEILNSVAYTYPEVGQDMSARIGMDEAGKGDFFGPLCIASFYASNGQVVDLLKMGVRDSKKMSDGSVIDLSKKLKAFYPHKVLKLFPETYNKLYDKFHNLNRMLAWGHTTALEELSIKTECKKAVLDRFADKELMQSFLQKKNLGIDLTQRFKGEEDPVVAAASILARGAFLEGLKDLEEKFQVKLPKGASAAVITAAKKAVERHGAEILPLISKSHFKTTSVVLGSNNDA